MNTLHKISTLVLLCVFFSTSAKVSAEFTYQNQCENNLIFFEDQSKSVSSKIVSWYWDFGDNAVAIDQHPVHVYSKPGLYEVKLVVKNEFNKTDTILKKVDISPIPVLIREEVLLRKDSSKIQTSPGVKKLNYLWNFGDGTYSLHKNPFHQFKDPGEYEINLRIKTTAGCTDQVRSCFYVVPNQFYKFSVEPVGFDSFILQYQIFDKQQE